MAAYLIADITVTDAAAFEEYRKGVPETITAVGGRYLARGGASEVLEGDVRPNRLVVLEFPDMETLKRWYDSKQYKPLRRLRQRASTGNLIAVEGL